MFSRQEARTCDLGACLLQEGHQVIYASRTLTQSEQQYPHIEYRNTPVTGISYSPSQLLMSRMKRTKIPIVRELLINNSSNCDKNFRKRITTKEPNRYRHSQKAKVYAYVKTWFRYQLKRASTSRSYMVTTADGQEYRRNRRDLQKTNEAKPVK